MRQPEVATAARRALGGLPNGRLRVLPITLRFWDGSILPGAERASGGPVVVVRSPRALAYLLRRPGEVGLARAWVTGALDIEGDLEAVLRLRDRLRGLALSRLDRVRLGLSALRTAPSAVLGRAPIPAIEARPRGRPHSLARDRAAVRHHYDVSNEFYRLLLGPSLTYSCAYFADPGEELEVAQERKHEVIARKLRLARGERLLDVGCGWGSLLLHAAARYGVRGVGVTLSAHQAELARRRVRESGLSDLVEIRIRDYRMIADGPFDKVVSVGMYEHVGRAELGRYASTIARLLRPGGLFLNHGIARLHSLPPDGDTFISRYIFPDGELHPVTEIVAAMQATGLELRDAESLREHYPLTLRRWAANLDEHRSQAVASAGAERVRAWRLYLLASAQAFEDGEIGVYQVLAAKPGGPHRLPLDRVELLTASGLETQDAGRS